MSGTGVLEQQATEQAEPRRPGLPGWLVPAGLALALLALAGGLLLGQRSARGVPAVTDPVSVGFLRDMKVHHAQAVVMSAAIHRRTDDPELRSLAFDVLTTQQAQVGIMTGWLDLSRQAQTSSTTMAWTGQPHTGPMPGTATPQQVASLDTLPLPQATEQFLRLMVRHHAGALDMAGVAAARAEQPDVVRLADGVRDAQASEIEAMQQLLAERGLAREPVAAAGHSGH